MTYFLRVKIALIVVACFAAAPPAIAVSLGLDVTEPGMTRQTLAQVLVSRAMSIKNRADGRVESSLLDPSQTPVTVLFTFEPPQDVLGSVEFQVSGPASNGKFLGWLSQQLRNWGDGKSRSAEPSKLQEEFCAARNISVAVSLTNTTAALSYFYSPNGFRNCIGEQSDPRTQPVAFIAPPMLSNSRTGGVTQPAMGVRPLTTSSTSAAPLSRALNDDYADMSKCSFVNLFLSTMDFPAEKKRKYRAKGEELFLKIYELGNQLGFSTKQITAEGEKHDVGFASLTKDERLELLARDRRYCSGKGLFED